MGQFDDRGKHKLQLHCNNFYFFKQESMFYFTVSEGKVFLVVGYPWLQGNIRPQVDKYIDSLIFLSIPKSTF